MYKVLIIDDDKLARKGLISMVKWEDYGLTVVGDVANGMQALQFLENNQVDLAFVNLSMPVLSGMDFIRESSQKFPKVKYVILTFHEDFENVQNALRHGAIDYISKLRLEEMDNEKVFARIGRLMRETSESEKWENKGFISGVDLPEQGEEVSYEKIEELRSQWTAGQWIYNKRLFDGMLDNLQEINLSARQTERLLMWVSQELEKSFDVVIAVPWLGDKEEGIGWLVSARENLCREARNIRNYHNMRMCILRAVLFIEDNISSKLSAEYVAGKVNMSRSYFSTNFKLVTGETFNDFLKEEKMSQAKKRLETENIKAADLAEQLGYEDPKYFAKLFFNEMGMNCSEYAKQFSSKRREKKE